MSNIKVPEDMLNAAWRAVAEKMRECVEEGKGNRVSELYVARISLEAALRCLSENPIVPTDEQWEEISKDAPLSHKRMPYDWVLKEWQRRMFLAPEPEVDRIDYYRKTPDGEYVLMSSVRPGEVFVDNSEPETPEEIKDLLHPLPLDGSEADPWKRPPADITNQRIIEAYRRGQKAGNNDPDSVMELIERRMAEYSNWVHRNLQNLFDKKPLEPRLDWDAQGGKRFTYADVVKK